MNRFEKEAWDEYVHDYKGEPLTWKSWAIIAVLGFVTYVFATGLNTIFGG